jgi:hypothetical protein
VRHPSQLAGDGKENVKIVAKKLGLNKHASPWEASGHPDPGAHGRGRSGLPATTTQFIL